MDNQIVSYSGDPRQPQYFDFNGFRVPIKYDRDGNPWFSGPDVCKAVGIANTSNAYARLDDDEKMNLHLMEGESTQSGKSPVYVSESGLYNLILRSDKPQAKAFKKHVTSVVLPSIRKNGAYFSKSFSAGDMLVAMAENFRALENKVDRGFADTAQSIEAINSRLDNAEYYTIEAYCNVQGIKSTQSIRQKWGKDASELSRARGIQIRKIPTPDKPWSTENIYHQSILVDACVAKQKHGNQLTLLGDQ